MTAISLSLRRKLNSNKRKFKTHKGLRKRVVINSHGVKMKRIGANKYATKKSSRRARRTKGLSYVSKVNLPIIKKMILLSKRSSRKARRTKGLSYVSKVNLSIN